MRVLRPREMKKALREGMEASDVLNDLIEEDLQKAKKDGHLNPDNTFKGGFKGCVRYQMDSKGLAKENAQKLCAYIGRRAGKIP